MIDQSSNITKTSVSFGKLKVGSKFLDGNMLWVKTGHRSASLFGGGGIGNFEQSFIVSKVTRKKKS